MLSQGPIHYDTSHGMSLEASGCSTSIFRHMETFVGPLSMLFDPPLCKVSLYLSKLCIRYLNLPFILGDHHLKNKVLVQRYY